MWTAMRMLVLSAAEFTQWELAHSSWLELNIAVSVDSLIMARLVLVRI